MPATQHSLGEGRAGPSLGLASGPWILASGSKAHTSSGHMPWKLLLLSPHQALSNRGQHSISYTLSRSHSVIVEYTHDSDTDMFQVCSGSSACLLVTGPPGLEVQLCRRSRVNLEDRGCGEVALGAPSIVDYAPDEEAGCPGRAVDFLGSHSNLVATSNF